MKKSLILLFLVFPFLSYGQSASSIKYDEQLICKQFNTALEYLTKTKKFKVKFIKVNNLIRDGWGYEYFANQYVAKKLNVPIKDIYKEDHARINEIYALFDKKAYLSGYTINSDCFSKKREPNTLISKLDSNSMLLYITTSRIGDEGATGAIFLFYFDVEGNVESFYETSWMS